MTSSRTLPLLPVYSVLLLSSLFHLFIAPYTKVEESFTLHAVWDILTHGKNIGNYDHWEFPGAVKRSFIPPFLLSCLAYPLALFPEVNTQFAIRLVLLAICQLQFHAYARKVAKLYGVTAAIFFLLFTASQFHLQFYLSRTLPNFCALPIVVTGFTQLLSVDIASTINSRIRSLQLGIACLLCVGIIARSEIAVLCGVIIFVDIILSSSPIRYILSILPAVIVGGIFSIAATVVVDTYLWSSPSFPELEALLFNVVSGHASEWGVEPWYFYILSLPKLLLNPMTLILIVSTIVITWYSCLTFINTLRKLRYIVIVPIVYVFGFSFLAHKEWRFIIYVVPLLTTASSISAAYLHNHRTKSFLNRLLHTLLILSIPVSLITSLAMGLVSSTNYPGACALDSLHAMSNATTARVYLDIPTRMTGATLPLCTRLGWTYTKSENTTELASTEYWRNIDFAIVGSLADVPCKRGKGIQGKHEWEVIHRQKGYAGIEWRRLDIPNILRNSTIVGKAISNVEKAQRLIADNWAVKNVMLKVERMLSNDHIRKIVNPLEETATRFLGRIQEFVEGKGGLKVPWIKLEDKVYVLKHLRQEDLLERSMLFEEQREKERRGLGKQGEVEGQWRDFY